jgi:hypothetical protein
MAEVQQEATKTAICIQELRISPLLAISRKMEFILDVTFPKSRPNNFL